MLLVKYVSQILPTFSFCLNLGRRISIFWILTKKSIFAQIVWLKLRFLPKILIGRNLVWTKIRHARKSSTSSAFWIGFGSSTSNSVTSNSPGNSESSINRWCTISALTPECMWPWSRGGQNYRISAGIPWGFSTKFGFVNYFFGNFEGISSNRYFCHRRLEGQERRDQDF